MEGKYTHNILYITIFNVFTPTIMPDTYAATYFSLITQDRSNPIHQMSH